MRRFGRGLVAAMEEEQQQAAAEENTLPEGAENLETELLDVQESAAEGEKEEADLAETAEVSEALESIVVSLEACAANGGLTREGAQALGTAVDFMYSRVGISKKAMPALESFGGQSSRVGQTRVAMEDIKEQIKKIWDAIINAIKKAAAWVTDHFNKVFGAAEKLQKRAEAISKAADGVTGKAENQKITNGGLFKALQINGSVDGVVAGIKKVAELAKEQLDTKANEKIKSAEGQIEAIEDPIGKADSFTCSPVQGNKVGENEGFANAGDGMEWVRGDELPGGMALVSRTPAAEAKGLDGIRAAARSRTSIQAFNPKAKDSSKEDLKVLSTGDVMAVAEAVKTIGAEVQAFRKTQKKLEEILKKAVSAAEKAGKSAEGEEDKTKKDAFKTVAGLASSLPGNIVTSFTSVSQYGLKAGKAALDLCELSLKEYK